MSDRAVADDDLDAALQAASQRHPSRHAADRALKIADLRAPAHETRKLKEGHIREVANGIQALGFSVPVLVGKNNEIIDGLSAVKAAESLGLTSVPCVRIDHLSEPEQRVLHLAINRMTANGEWNLDALKLEFEEHPDGSPA